ncbi:hypothetical protein PA598K_05933 [Paenibacillus sp. 598K]|uniref:YhcN/YlaJ family sporulation lipoprotein n=1 Tax=Paenibacillus sp. 598K TaxID=1117987 RepID=UPI000FF9E78F|nr:YhcN/YlaJ family sporulation lipoprotein [Paenibacillus sp. 598K]GBF77385.1 hypothetical protein PA598K_05933 [Paenibacillus sp. 598K]
MNRRMSWTTAMLTVCISVALLSGCAAPKTNPDTNDGNTVKQQTMRTEQDMREMGKDVGRDLGMTQDPTHKIGEMDNHDHINMKKAEHVAASAQKVAGVTKATAVVHDQDIIVGLDMDGSDQAMLRKKENEVKRKIKQEHEGYNVHVTSDKNLHSKIQTLHGNAMNGHPVAEFTHDVGMIIRDIGNAVAAPFR